MNQDFFENIPEQVLTHLTEIELSVPSQSCHEAIDELLSRTVLEGGKRLRPLLTFLFADFFCLDLSKVSVSARAIEMVHAASLAHDDVIDEASVRRGSPSINIQASNKKAVLAGDYLLASVIGELTRQGNLRLVREMAWVIEELSTGEWVQADAVVSRKYTSEILNSIAMKKTSSVMSWCAVAPAVLSDSGEEVISLAKEFGKYLGLAFQLLDDTLDFSEDSKKDSLLDLKNGQINSVLFEWLLLNPLMKERYENGEDISELFIDSDIAKATEIIREVALTHLKKCSEILYKMEGLTKGSGEHDPSKRVAPLIFILKFLEDRKH